MSKERLQVMLDPELASKVRKEAKANGDKVAYWLRKIITMYYSNK